MPNKSLSRYWKQEAKKHRKKGRTQAEGQAALQASAAGQYIPNTITPAWKQAQSQAQQAMSDIRAGIADDGSLRRQQMFQDISISGLSPDQQEMMALDVEPKINALVTAAQQEAAAIPALKKQKMELKKGKAERRIQRDVDDSLGGITSQVAEILSPDNEAPHGEKLRQIESIRLQRPKFLGNKVYNDVFTKAKETIRGIIYADQSAGGAGKKSVPEEIARQAVSQVGGLGIIEALITAYPDQKEILNPYLIAARGYGHQAPKVDEITEDDAKVLKKYFNDSKRDNDVFAIKVKQALRMAITNDISIKDNAPSIYEELFVDAEDKEIHPAQWDDRITEWKPKSGTVDIDQLQKILNAILRAAGPQRRTPLQPASPPTSVPVVPDPEVSE